MKCILIISNYRKGKSKLSAVSCQLSALTNLNSAGPNITFYENKSVIFNYISFLTFFLQIFKINVKTIFELEFNLKLIIKLKVGFLLYFDVLLKKEEKNI